MALDEGKLDLLTPFGQKIVQQADRQGTTFSEIVSTIRVEEEPIQFSTTQEMRFSNTTLSLEKSSGGSNQSGNISGNNPFDLDFDDALISLPSVYSKNFPLYAYVYDDQPPREKHSTLF